MATESDADVKAALSLASSRLESRLVWGERLGLIFTGVSLGSILLLVALGPIIPEPLDTFAAGVTLLGLTWSFAVDVRRLWRGRFLPPAPERAALLSWLMFVATGIGPFSGQAVHFRHFAPEKVPYADDRYQFEVRRHYGVLDQHLAGREWMVGDAYSIVDMALWGWARMLPFILGEGAFTGFPNLKRHHDAIAARPAAAKAVALKDRFTFKAEMDAEARAHMFKHVKPAA